MPRKDNEEEIVDENWVDETEHDDYDIENESERKFVYNNMCSDDEETATPDYLNQRYKKRIVKSVVVNLPTMSSEKTRETSASSASEEPGSVKLTLPSGGWQVKKVEVAEITSSLPSLSDSKLHTTPKKRFSAGRDEKGWKKMDFFIPLEDRFETPAPKDDGFRVVKKSRERVAHPPSEERAPPPQEAPRNLKCTKMCNSGKDCKRVGCNFAHNIDEFNPITCRFQSRCKNPQVCSFKHDFETKENYLARFQALQVQKK